MTKNCQPQVGYCLPFLLRTLSLFVYFNVHLEGIDLQVLGTEGESADIIADTNNEICSGKVRF